MLLRICLFCGCNYSEGRVLFQILGFHPGDFLNIKTTPVSSILQILQVTRLYPNQHYGNWLSVQEKWTVFHCNVLYYVSSAPSGFSEHFISEKSTLCHLSCKYRVLFCFLRGELGPHPVVLRVIPGSILEEHSFWVLETIWNAGDQTQSASCKANPLTLFSLAFIPVLSVVFVFFF